MVEKIPTKDVPGVVKVSAAAIGAIPEPAKVGDTNIAPTTTAAQDLETGGQRHINRVWEYTQAAVAIMVTGATLGVAGRLALSKEESGTAAFLLLSNVFFMVMGMYFQRTNHTRIGGVEAKHRGE